MNRTTQARVGRWILFAAPGAGLFVVSLAHPNPFALATVYQSVSPVVDWWITLHILLFALFTQLAFGLFVSLSGVSSMVATTARVALGLFVAVMCAFVGDEGIGMGLVIRGGQGLAATQQAGVDQAVQALWDSPTSNVLGQLHSLLFVLSVGASAVALYTAAQRPLPLALLGLLAVWGLTGVSLLHVPVPLWVGVSLALFVAVVTVVGRNDRVAMVPFGLLVVAMWLPQHGTGRWAQLVLAPSCSGVRSTSGAQHTARHCSRHLPELGLGESRAAPTTTAKY